jgi:site-specific recombinase XerD
MYSSSLTISATVDWFLADCRARNLTPRSIGYYAERLRPFVADHGERPVASLAPIEIKLWVQARREAKGWAANTTNHTIASLRVYFRFLVAEELLPNSPADKLRPLKTDEILPEPFSDDEIRRLLASVPKDFLGARDAAMLVVLLDCGLRLAELLDLTVGAVSLDTGIISVVRGKGGKGRTVPYSAPVRRALLRWAAHRDAAKPDTDALWIAEDGHPLSREAMKSITRRWERQSGVEGVHWHRFRHTFAHAYLQGGGSPAHLQHLLGHSSPDMTQRYSHMANLDATDDHRKASPATRLLGHRWRG